MERDSRILASLSTRRPKWQYHLAPTPRILHLPMRHHKKKQPKPSFQQHQKSNALRRLSSVKEKKGKLEALFDQERVFARQGRPIVMNSRGNKAGFYNGSDGEKEKEKRESWLVEEEKWRFQAEILMAECNLLRMDREISVKKMERRRVQMDRALRFAVQILVSGQQRIHWGKNAATSLMEEEIEHLVEKLEKLQRRIRAKDQDVRNCTNFDRQMSLLGRRLDKFGTESDKIRVKEIQEIAETSLSIKTTCNVDKSFPSNGSCNMEIPRSKMQKLSKGTLFELIKDEYGSMLSTAKTSTTSSAFFSKRIEFLDMPPTTVIHPPFKTTMRKEVGSLCQLNNGPPEEKGQSGCCKTLVRKVVEQVRTETEQWSQMQEILGQVREEMEELRASRAFWKDRALDSDCQVRSLCSSVEKLRMKFIRSESMANELQSQISVLQKELKRLRKKIVAETASTKNMPVFSMSAPSKMEKQVLVCWLKENHHQINERRRKALSCTKEVEAMKHLPLSDIGNSLPLMRQNARPAFSLQQPLPFSVQEKI